MRYETYRISTIQSSSHTYFKLLIVNPYTNESEAGFDQCERFRRRGIVSVTQSARRESRIKSCRGIMPRSLLLVGQCQARIAIGRRSWVASPTPNPTWPPHANSRGSNRHPSLRWGIVLLRAFHRIEATDKNPRRRKTFRSLHPIVMRLINRIVLNKN